MMIPEFPMKRGRKPLFTSREVDEIQHAEDTLEHLAARYRTSRSTIARIRSNFYQYGSVDSAEKAHTHAAPPRQARTRPVKLDEATLINIACDLRPQRVVAEHWGISIPYVAKIRARYNTTNVPGGLVHKNIESAIINSDKTDEEVAKQFAIPEVIVRRVRYGKEEPTGV